MRISPPVLLVVLAVTVPFVLQIRTVASFVGIELSVVQTGLIGAIVAGAIVAWSLWPKRSEATPCRMWNDEDA